MSRRGRGEEGVGEGEEMRRGLLSRADFGLGRPGGSPMLGSMLGAKLYEQTGGRGCVHLKEKIARGCRGGRKCTDYEGDDGGKKQRSDVAACFNP